MVTKDVPDNGVVVGVPGRVVPFDGSAHHVEFTDYQSQSVGSPGRRC